MNSGIRAVAARRPEGASAQARIYDVFDGQIPQGPRPCLEGLTDGNGITLDGPEEFDLLPTQITAYDRISVETGTPLHDEELLSKLATTMVDWPARWGRHRFEAQGIPAAFTYLGQLIAHDLSYCDPTEEVFPAHFQAACLDFTSIFARDPALTPGTQVCEAGGFALGCTSTGRIDDLPRTANAEPILKDRRNDQNLTLSQLVVLVTKFYQLVANRTADAADAQAIARRHMQWIVLHDYLPRIIDGTVYRDVIRTRNCPLLADGAGLIPIEFAAAAFRLGHAMVRQRYPHWRRGGSGAGLGDLLGFTHHSAVSRFGDVQGDAHLPDDWGIGWQYLLGADDQTPRISLAAAIDENLALDMFSLPGTIGDCVLSAPRPVATGQGGFNLAEHTLIRGNRLRMDSGQSFAAQAHERLRDAGAAPLPRRLPAMRVAQTRSPSLSVWLMSDEAKKLRTETPLWFYFLREADVHTSGQYFGPLASRVTMETIYSAIRSDPGGILHQNFKPDFSDENGRFGLKELHDAVRKHWKPPT